ncbi:MAG: carboxypeptidase-like regulatory domain-containing protein [Chitinophagaceae bacterium]|nr:carboxypeptidase-like regulatory domain-containing protein [Chitinophagaceae bacterium]
MIFKLISGVFFLLLISCIGIQIGNAQSKKCAFVLDAKTNQPVPFATVVSKGFGTFTDSTGIFYTNENVSDTFTISSIGYKEQNFVFSESLKCDTIYLESNPLTLSNIVIGKYSWLLNSFVDQIGMKNVKETKHSTNVIEGVTIIKYFPHPDTAKDFIISSFSIRVSQKSPIYKPRKVRVKIFAPDINKKPGVDIIQTNEIITIYKPTSDYVEMDLNKYHVVAPKDGYFIGLEFLTPKIDESDAGSFSLPGKITKEFENGEVFIRYYTNVFRSFTFSASQKVNVFFNTRLYEYK